MSVDHCEFERIDLGTEVPHHHGHVVHVKASYTAADGGVRPIVYKENKAGHAELSRFEVAFSALARLFLSSELTPRLSLVKNAQHAVCGVACEHVSETIARREGLPTFYSVNLEKEKLNCTPQIVARVSDIPYYFLDQYPASFFSTLMQAEKKGELLLDFSSLAEILACSYTLEEDDLHKGNIGFYVKEEQAKPKVCFFKIDHDLMLADSVMSHCHARALNWGYGAHAFDISKRDLVHFPLIHDSKNHYWPTTRRAITGLGRKAYKTETEVQSYASLASSVEFREKKWLAFYKHILIPKDVIESSLSEHLDRDDPVERAELRLVTQAVLARQAKLRANLFAIEEFRQFVVDLSQDEAKTRALCEAVFCGDLQCYGDDTAVQQTLNEHFRLCDSGNEQGFKRGDTPLHVAIRLNDYRYYETWDAFGQFVHNKNVEGETALDVAVSLAKQSPEDIRADSLCTMKHLLLQGALKTVAFNTYIGKTYIGKTKLCLRDYSFQVTGYPSQARQATDVAALKRVLRDLSEDPRYCLKMQKEIAVLCLQQFIKCHRNNPDLKTMLLDFKLALNGQQAKAIAPASELQFIRQLRSRLWIVRVIRGLMGGTSTQVQLNSLINKTLKELSPRPSFFRCWRKAEPPASALPHSINQP
jgi:hypothetical protein